MQYILDGEAIEEMGEVCNLLWCFMYNPHLCASGWTTCRWWLAPRLPQWCLQPSALPLAWTPPRATTMAVDDQHSKEAATQAWTRLRCRRNDPSWCMIWDLFFHHLLFIFCSTGSHCHNVQDGYTWPCSSTSWSKLALAQAIIGLILWVWKSFFFFYFVMIVIALENSSLRRLTVANHFTALGCNCNTHLNKSLYCTLEMCGGIYKLETCLIKKFFSSLNCSSSG